MRLNRLAVTDYRNLSAAVLEPAPQLTVLCGANGQGKTNLLEAVWLLTGGKSFRGAKDAELIRRGADFAVLEAAFDVQPVKYLSTLMSYQIHLAMEPQSSCQSSLYQNL